jgi:hypothetical protein
VPGLGQCFTFRLSLSPSDPSALRPFTFTLHPLCSSSDCASVLVRLKAAAALRAVARGLASLVIAFGHNAHVLTLKGQSMRRKKGLYSKDIDSTDPDHHRSLLRSVGAQVASQPVPKSSERVPRSSEIRIFFRREKNGDVLVVRMI